MKKMRENHKKQFLGLGLLHWIVVLASATLTLVAWRVSQTQYQARIEARFDQQAQTTVNLIEERIRSYADGLWAGVAFYNANKSQITYNEWKVFAQSLKLPEKYPGINGLGVIFNIDPKELPQFLKDQRSYRPNFGLHHSKDEIYYPITYIEPEKGNEEAIGLDISFEKNRLKAAIEAEDSGKARMTGPIILVQDERQKPGFLFYAPFYEGQKYSNIEERRENFKGMVYAPLIVEKLVYGVLSPQERLVDISVSDNDILLYNEHKDPNHTPLFQKEVSKEIYGRKWNFQIKSNKEFKKALGSDQSSYFLLSGIVIDFLLIILFLNLSKAQNKAVKLARKMAEEAKIHRRSAEHASKLAALGEMAAGIAHEINNPLSVILGYSALLSEMEKSDDLNKHSSDIKKATNKIESSVKRITNITNGLREFARNESGENRQIESLNSIISETVEFAKEGFKIKDLNITLNLGSDTKIICNKVQISQVLINLLSNAQIEAQKSNEKEIEVFTKLNHKRKTTSIGISNTGDKIPEEIQEKIFQPFFTTKKAGEGTGIGLSISKNLVEAHGGQLYLDKEKERTTFVIELPVV